MTPHGRARALALYAAALFVLNSRHHSQELVYREHHLLAAQKMHAGAGFVDRADRPAFYPIWGYAGLVWIGLLLGRPDAFLFTLQWMAALAGVAYFYRLFRLEPSFWHWPLLVPYFGYLSVRWPDGLTAPLLLALLWHGRQFLTRRDRRDVVAACVCMGLLVNLRSEYLVLPAFFLALQLRCFALDRKAACLLTVAMGTAAVLFLLPWALRSWYHTGLPRLSSSNGGAVLFISLGQLPGNPWHVRHDDREYFEFAAARGWDSPYSVASDAALGAEFLRRVRAHPAAFAAKVLRNLGATFVSGVYVGEYSAWLSNDPSDVRIRSRLAGRPLREGLASLPLAALVTLALHGVFAIVTAVLWAGFARSLRRPGSLDLATFGVVAALVACKLALVALIQLEPRHLDPVYLPLLGTTLSRLDCAAAPYLAARVPCE